MANFERLIVHGTGSAPQYEFDGDDYDAQYLGARGTFRAITSWVRGCEDRCVVPGEQVNDTIDYLVSNLLDNNIPDYRSRFFSTSGQQYLLWQDLLQDWDGFMDWLDVQSNSAELALLPYMSTPDYWQVFERLTANGYTVGSNMDRVNPEDWLNRSNFAHKGAYFDWYINGHLQSQPQRYDYMPRPRGYVVTQTSDAKDVINTYFSQSAMVVKPIYGGGGFGIEFFDDNNTAADFFDTTVFEVNPFNPELTHPLLIQERVNILQDDWGEVGLSVQFQGQTIRAITRTFCDGAGHWTGNVLLTSDNCQKYGLTRREYQQVVKQTTRLLADIKPTGVGGIDFAKYIDPLTQNECVGMIELNGGRTTGAEEAIHFAKTIGPDRVVGLRKYNLDPERNLSIFDIDERLRSKCINYSHINRQGVLPFACYGDHLSVVIAAQDSAQLVHFIEEVGNETA